MEDVMERHPDGRLGEKGIIFDVVGKVRRITEGSSDRVIAV